MNANFDFNYSDNSLYANIRFFHGGTTNQIASAKLKWNKVTSEWQIYKFDTKDMKAGDEAIDVLKNMREDIIKALEYLNRIKITPIFTNLLSQITLD
ncbi:MAG: hypothetical protein AABY22_25510 [Nanoarchaeota archaeon]